MTKPTAETAPRNANHPPLARDAQGNLLQLPEGTAALRIRRQTKGRPRTIHAPDRTPVRLQLETTPEDVADMFGPGTYRLDATDEVGQPIDYLTTLVIAPEAGAGVVPTDASAANAPRVAPSTDLRFALETITQITRAQSDSLRAIAEAQADWLKGLATAKALPRNGYTPQPPPPPPPAAALDDDQEDEDDEEEEEPEEDRLQTLVATIAPAIAALLARWTKPRAEDAPEPRNARTNEPNAMLKMSRIQARLTPYERRFLRAMLEGRRGAEFAQTLADVSIEEAVEGIQQLAVDGAEEAQRMRNGTAPKPAPDMTVQVLAVAAHLDLADQSRVMALVPRLAQARRDELQAQLTALAPPDAAAWIKENLGRLEAEVSS